VLQPGVVEEGGDGEGGNAEVDQSDVELVARLENIFVLASLLALSQISYNVCLWQSFFSLILVQNARVK
jgi:hypothetical protein